MLKKIKNNLDNYEIGRKKNQPISRKCGGFKKAFKHVRKTTFEQTYIFLIFFFFFVFPGYNKNLQLGVYSPLTAWSIIS